MLDFVDNGAGSHRTPLSTKSTVRDLAVTGAVMLTAAAPWPLATADAGLAGPIMLGGAILLALVALMCATETAGNRWPRGLTWFGLFTLWGGLSTVWGQSTFHASEMLAVWMAGLAVSACLALAVDTTSSLRRCIRTMILATVALTVYGLVGYLHANPPALRFTATFTNADCLSAMLVIAFGLALGMVGDASRLDVMLSSVSLVVLTVGLVSTASRAGAMGAMAALVMHGFLLLRFHMGLPKLMRAIIPIAGTLLVLLAAGALAGVGARWSSALGEQGSEGFAVRRMVLEGTLPTLRAAPWMGCGPSNFAQAFLPNRPHASFRGYVNQAHIDPVQVLVETGCVGFILFVGTLVTALRDAVKGARSRGTSAAGAAAAICGFTVYGLSNFALPVPADFIWFSAALGIAWRFGKASASHSSRSDEPHPSRARTAGLVLATVASAGMAVFCGLTGWHTDRGHRLTVKAQALFDALRWEEASAAVDQALTQQPGNERLYALRAEAELRRASLTRDEALLTSASADMRRALSLDPAAKGLRIEAAHFFIALGDRQTAERLLKEARDGCPTDIGPWAELAALYHDEHRYTEAADCLFHILPDLPEASRALASELRSAQASGQGGVSALDRYRAALTPDTLHTIAVQAATDAIARSQPAVALAFDRLQLSWDGHDACAALGVVQNMKGTDAQRIEILEQALLYRDGAADEPQAAAHVSAFGDACYNEAFMTLMDLYISRRDYGVAANLLTRYLDRVPSSTAAHLKLADVYQATGRLEMAIATLQEARSRDADNPQIDARLKDLYARSSVHMTGSGEHR